MNKDKLIDAFLEKATVYKVEVRDNSMLPSNLKDKKSLDFISNPPSIAVLAKCAQPLLEVPEDIRTGKSDSIEDAIKYANNVAQCLSILFHAKIQDPPEWYAPFLLNNLTSKEMYMVFQETVFKTQSGFFLNCFQIADVGNPMMMKMIPKRKKGLTPSN